MQKNEFILDGRVQCEPTLGENGWVTFNISIRTGENLLALSSGEVITRPAYTYIRVLSDLPIEEVKLGNYYRFKGKLGSEKYITSSGKAVYNKVLVVEAATLLEYSKEEKCFVEVK